VPIDTILFFLLSSYFSQFSLPVAFVFAFLFRYPNHFLFYFLFVFISLSLGLLCSDDEDVVKERGPDGTGYDGIAIT